MASVRGIGTNVNLRDRKRVVFISTEVGGIDQVAGTSTGTTRVQPSRALWDKSCVVRLCGTDEERVPYERLRPHSSSAIYIPSTRSRAHWVLRRNVRLDLTLGLFKKQRTGRRRPSSAHPCRSTSVVTIFSSVMPCKGSRGWEFVIGVWLTILGNELQQNFYAERFPPI